MSLSMIYSAHFERVVLFSTTLFQNVLINHINQKMVGSLFLKEWNLPSNLNWKYLKHTLTSFRWKDHFVNYVFEVHF